MSRDVIDFNEKVYQAALELAEARGASEDVLQGLTTLREFTDEELKLGDAGMKERLADLLTGETGVRSNAADVLAYLRGREFRLIMDAAGHVRGQRIAPNGTAMRTRELLFVDVISTGDIWLKLDGDYGITTKELRLPCVGMLVQYYNSYTSGTKYVYSLWVTAYRTGLAQNILQYNLPTSVPFMDEEG